MRWLERLFHKGKDRAPRHTYLSQMPHWRIVGAHVFHAFFRALPTLVPVGSVLYIENTRFWPEVDAYLAGRALAQPERKIERGTILPRPKCFHVPTSDAVLNGLAAIAERHAEPEIADHMVAYDDQGVLVEWYDAGLDPIFVSKRIPEGTVAAFCARISATFDELT